MTTKPWYVSAFGEHYEDLYHHRNDQDAARAIAFLRDFAGIDPARQRGVLDLCCGSGRHSLQWPARRGPENSDRLAIVGLDLAPNLLAEAARTAAAQGARLPLARGDMRRLPFRDGAFALTLNLFTSFGYFTEESQNAAVFAEVRRVLERPGGLFVFDHINPARLRANLVPESRRTTPSGAVAIERRSIDEARHRVEKRVDIQVDGKSRSVLESVRFYEREEVEAMADAAGLRPTAAFGDFDGSPLTPESPRAIYLFAAR